MISQALTALLERYGNELLDDHERFEVLLKHRCPQQSTDAVLAASRLGLLNGLLQVGFPSQGRDQVGQALQDWIAHNGGESESAAAEASKLWLDALTCPQLPEEQEEIVVTPAGPSWEEVAAKLPQGGKIRLQAGTYKGTLELPKARFELIGEGEVLWNTPADAVAVKVDGGWLEAKGVYWRGHGGIEVASGWVWLDSCKLEGLSDTCWPRLGLSGKGAYASLSHCKLIGPSESGVFAQEGSCVRIVDSLVVGHWDSLLDFRGCCAIAQRCRLVGPSPTGVVNFHANVYLQDCSVKGCEEGVMAHGAFSKMVMDKCEISGSEIDGAGITETAQLIARDCGFNGNQRTGLTLNSRAVVNLENCRIQCNGGFGISSTVGSKVHLKSTSFQDNALGERSETEQ